MLELSNELIAIIGFLAGPLGKTLYDFFWKLAADPDIVFDKKYWITMFASMGIGFFAALVELAAFLQNIPVGSQAYIFLASFAQGFMVNHVINRPVDYSRHKKENEGG